MKKVTEGKYEDSFVATNKELLEMEIPELPFFDESCSLCGKKSDKWFIHKNAGSGSMDDWICAKCIKKINKLLNELEIKQEE